jgi:hypothetical protein
MEQSFNWIKTAISTSVNEFHLEGCKILIGLFIKKYEGEILAVPAYMELMDDYLEKETFLSVEV